MRKAPDPFAVLAATGVSDGTQQEGVRSVKDKAPDPFAVLAATDASHDTQ